MLPEYAPALGKSTSNGQGSYNLSGHIANAQRFKGDHHCPICDGAEDDARGQGRRCIGFISQDGEWCHCSREEHAGRAVFNPGSQCYPHKLKGKCPCGTEHNLADPKPTKAKKKRGTFDRSYPYVDRDGRLAFEAVRWKDPKSFSQRRPDGKGGWLYNLDGVEPFLYRLPELIEADPAALVLVPEGEKDTDRLRALGFVATCNPMGCGKWKVEYAHDLRGRRVVVLPDNDQAGRDHARQVARSLAGIAAEVKVLELPGLPDKGDVSDWLDAGGTAEGLRQLIADTSAFAPAPGQPAEGNGLILITAAEKQVNDQAIEALAAADPNLFCLGYVLATVVHDGGAPRGVEYLDGPPPRLAPIASATLRERMAASAVWLANRDGKQVEAHPPDWSVRALMERGIYPGVRRIVGVIEAPTVRRDGSILDTPGYDKVTGLFYSPTGGFKPIPARPIKADAAAAAVRLLDLVGDFPFMDDDHKAAWLAALLSVLARPAIDGPVPLFAFDGNCPGTGKSLLADLIAIIATERRMPRTIWPHGRDADEEMRKRITSLALAGERFTLLDNIAWPHTLGGAPLDAALTSCSWKDRILGRSQDTGELPLTMVWFATGNNVQLGTDVIRRIIPCRLVSPLESPEDREGFKYPDLLKHAKENRGAYLADGLTIVRAYFEAGTPGSVKALGSYESWSRVIVGAVKWATGLDPCGPRELVKAEDAGAQRRRALFEGLAELPGIFAGLTAAEIRKTVAENLGSFKIIREALMEFSRDAELPNSRTIGTQLRGMKDRVIGSYRLTSHEDTHSKVAKWSLVNVAGCAGSSGVKCGHPAPLDPGETLPLSTYGHQPAPSATHPATSRTPRTSVEDRETGEL